MFSIVDHCGTGHVEANHWWLSIVIELWIVVSHAWLVELVPHLLLGVTLDI